MDRIRKYFSDSIKYFFVAIYLLSDELIKIFGNRIFTRLFNARSFLIRSKSRFGYNSTTNLFFVHQNNTCHYFPNKQRGLDSYRFGLGARIKSISEVYLLEMISIREGDIIIDCGANVGDLLAAIGSMNVTYFGFEPSEKEFKCLDLNSKNQRCKSTLYNLGLWDHSGKVRFYLNSEEADSSIIQPKYFNEIVEIDTIRLDEVKELKDKHIKLLKIEAEGAEPEVLSGSWGLLNRIEFVVADLGFERGIDAHSTISPVTNTLINKGFELVHVSEGRRICLFRNKDIK